MSDKAHPGVLYSRRRRMHVSRAPMQQQNRRARGGGDLRGPRHAADTLIYLQCLHPPYHIQQKPVKSGAKKKVEI